MLIHSLHDYIIYVGSLEKSISLFFKEAPSYSQISVLVDENTYQYCWPILQASIPATIPTHIIVIASGEKNKNIQSCQSIWQQLLDINMDRKSLFINLGGGVITDMGGFAAATFKRGIDFLHIPTTLLAQVDASIGGKLGVDFQEVKNMIGLIKNPKAVLIDPIFLQTLAKRQIISGLAEMLKHALIADEKHLDDLLKIKSIASTDWGALIFHSLQIKSHIVDQDPYEKGLRKVLNFGHTIGHAVESYSLRNDASPLLHGEAVAIGMKLALQLSRQKYSISIEKINPVIEFIDQYFPRYPITPDMYAPLLALMYKDKKNEQQQLLFTLLSEIGQATYNEVMSETNILEVLGND